MHIDESEVAVPSRFKTRAEIFDPAPYRALAQNKKVVAIGECGLDYWHFPPPSSSPTRGEETAANSPPLVGGVRGGGQWKQRQQNALRSHLYLADELDLPLILHCRGSKEDPTDAYRDQLAILQEYVQAGKIKRLGSIHCFISTWDIAQQYLALGFHIGFTGIITFPKTPQYAEVVRNTPLDRILVETDCPYLAPVPMRGKRNEPLYVRHVAEKVAEIRGVEAAKVEEQLFKNTLETFPKIQI